MAFIRSACLIYMKKTPDIMAAVIFSDVIEIYHPAGGALTSAWSVNGYITVAY